MGDCTLLSIWLMCLSKFSGTQLEDIAEEEQLEEDDEIGDEDDMSGFIVEEDLDEHGSPMRYTLGYMKLSLYRCLCKLFITYNSSFRRKVTRKQPRPGVSSSALQEAHEIFGNVDDLLKRRKQGKQGLAEMSEYYDASGRRKERRIVDEFEPTILSEKYMTEKDDMIRNTDFPERLQVNIDFGIWLYFGMSADLFLVITAPCTIELGT